MQFGCRITAIIIVIVIVAVTVIFTIITAIATMNMSLTITAILVLPRCSIRTCTTRRFLRSVPGLVSI